MRGNFMSIKNINWTKSKERDIDIAIQSIYMIGHGRAYFKNNGLDFEIKNYLALSDGKLFFDSEELNKARDIVLKWKSLAKTTKSITDIFMKIANSYEAFLEKNKDINFEQISNDEFKKIYKEYLQHNYNLVPYSFIISIIVEEVITEKIVSKLACESAEKLCLQLISLNKTTATTDEYLSRIELAKLAQTEEFNKAVEDHIKQFSWLFVYRPTDNPLSKEELVKNIKEMQTVSNPAKNNVPQVELDGNTKQLIEVMKENAWVRTYRRELMSKGFFVMRPMYERIAKEMHINFENLSKIACWEIETFLDTGKIISQEEIDRRKNRFTLIRLDGKIIFLSGQEAETSIIKKNKAIKEIKGQSAFEGIVQGTVKVVKTKEDLNSFEKGSILVAHTVATWMTPAVMKSSGIITEKSGVLSHTFIVAREFKKPCLVGIGDSIEYLKNGMIVRLDATTGIVREIK